LALSAAIICSVSASAEPFDVDRVSCLTLHYAKDGENFEGLAIKTYRIAELGDDGGYRLCGAFADYSVNVYAVSSQTEWRRITSTLAAYIAADGISPDREGVTDTEGRVSFTGLRTGLYLTLSVKRETKELVTVFEDFITAIPGRNSEGSYNYDVTAKPKYESFVPAPAEVEFKVVKQWKDTGAENKRPKSVDVDIFREGALVESVSLSAENDWCYKWTAPDDRSTWTAVERNIPEKYKVTVISDGRTIVITNSYEAPELPPDTGDTESLMQYVLMLSLSGLALIALGVMRMRAEK
jgi:hypothetical protein